MKLTILGGGGMRMPAFVRAVVSQRQTDGGEPPGAGSTFEPDLAARA
jgi:hypothetical protein